MDNPEELEKKSCAVSLSDMEIFVFPEVMFSLVLANIMSPVIWKWREDPWFSDIDKQKPLKKIQRLRQYIMDNFSFNLDLDTWGLTHKKKELDRFNDFIDQDILSQSNALFGYEGDKYYFDMDIRRHFGLDKYNSDIIPYWKTETVEAMEAFKYREGYETGAGECVSLAALWAAALFIICKIPLEDIFMLATPLHSQNFILMKDGIITNNRRIVTKNMWVNGTELSAKARRALENEQVTIVTHVSGHIHVMYGEETIDNAHYENFTKHLKNFLYYRITPQLLSNYIRYRSDLQKCFQLKREKNGVKTYIALEKVFAYEHDSNFSITGPSRKKLLEEIDSEEYDCSPLRGRFLLNDVEDYLNKNKVMPDDREKLTELKKFLDCPQFPRDEFTESLALFCQVTPRLPDKKAKEHKEYQQPIHINLDMNRNQIIEHLSELREKNNMAEYAFYAYRDLNSVDPLPFIKAAVERNPVCIEETKDLDDQQVIDKLKELESQSIYPEEFRLSQPDEVWNYKRGDGLEKAFTAANILRDRHPETEYRIQLKDGNAVLENGTESWDFPTSKKIEGDLLIIPVTF